MKNITASLKPFDTFVIFATTSSTITSSVTGFDLMVIPKSAAVACGLSIGNKVYMS